MTSGVNTESESDSVPDTGTDCRIGFCAEHEDESASPALYYGAFASGTRAQGVARYKHDNTFIGCGLECTESLRVTSW